METKEEKAINEARRRYQLRVAVAAIYYGGMAVVSSAVVWLLIITAVYLSRLIK